MTRSAVIIQSSALNVSFPAWRGEIEVSGSVLLIATISWFVAAIALALLYRKQAKWTKSALAIIFCVIGAASASSSFLHWQFRLERESARFLVGVAQLRFNEHIEFLQSYLRTELDRDSGDQRESAASMDWSGTFKSKHPDIQLELENVIKNAFIQRYYSVWAADATMHKQQLESLAGFTIAATKQQARRTTFDTYIDHVEAVGNFLGSLESEINTGTESTTEPELPTADF